MYNIAFFNQDYKNNKLDIRFINRKNFSLFKINNFLDENSYKFNKSFPEIYNKKLANFNLKKYL
jgi:hypothetical protein